MSTVLLVIAVAMGFAGMTLTREIGAEYVAKFIIDDEEKGASTRNPRMAEGPAPAPGATFEGPVTPVLAVAALPATAGSAPFPAAAPLPATEAADEGEPVASGSVANESAASESAASESGESAPGESTSAAAEAPPVAPAASEDGSNVLLSLIGDTPHPLPDGSVFVSIVTQRVFGLRTAIGEKAAVPVTVELPGRVITDPNTATLVQVDEASFVEAVDGKLPHVGQAVKRGDLLARLRPALTAMARAEIEAKIQALEDEIDLDRKRMARLEEVFFMRYRASKIEAMRIEIAGRQRQLAVHRASLRDRVELRARTDGLVSRVAAASGQYVEPGFTLFEIVDPTRLWVAATAYDPTLAGRLDRAEATTPEGERLALRFVGGGLTLRNQAVPLQFEILSPTAGLSVDKPLTVVVQTREQKVSGVKVPRSSLVRTNDGRTMLWERLSAESFKAHHVRTVPVDGGNVLVVSDLAGSIRVVTSGVAMLNQIR